MSRSAALALAVLTAPCLLAQTIDFGAQVTLAKPVMDVDGGTWLKGRGAVGFGLAMPLRLWRDQSLVPRLDVLNLRAGPVNLVSSATQDHLYTEQAKVQLLSLGMDYAYFFRSEEEGGYMGCGLAVAEGKFSGQVLTSVGEGAPVASWPPAQNKKAVQYAFLAGWKFNPFLGLEGRFTQADFKGLGTPGTLVKAPVFGLSLTAEF